MRLTPDTNVFLCKYSVRNFNVMNGDYRLDMNPSNILSIEYICDYEMSLFAILKVVLRVDVHKRIYMLKHKRDIRVKLEIDRVGMDVEVEGRKTNPEEIINQVFAVYFSDDDENMDTQALSDRDDVNVGGSIEDPTDPNHENYFESQNTIEIYLFNSDLLIASRYNFNMVYTESTLQNVVGHMLTASKHRSVLMSRFENPEKYRELLLPAYPVYKNLLYLDQYYGFYKTGALIFYDVDVLYVLSTNGKLTAHRDGEWTETIFLVPLLEESVPGNGVVRYPDEKTYYMTISEGDINHQATSVMRNISGGSKTKFVMTDGTEIVDVKADQEYIDHQTESVTYVKKENVFTETIIKARMEENDGIVFISANNLDISAFTPNKVFRIVYDEPLKHERYHGEYRLSYAYHCIRLESTEFSSCSHHIILKRTSPKSDSGVPS